MVVRDVGAETTSERRGSDTGGDAAVGCDEHREAPTALGCAVVHPIGRGRQALDLDTGGDERAPEVLTRRALTLDNEDR